MENLAYSNLKLNRASKQRLDYRWIQRTREKNDSKFIPLWHDQFFINSFSFEPLSLSNELLSSKNLIEDAVLLGLNQDQAFFAIDLSFWDRDAALQFVQASSLIDLRKLFGKLSKATADILAYARGLLYWHRHQQFCGLCGQKTISQQGGAFRQCAYKKCNTLYFPKISPAVIMLVELLDPNPTCLLARHHNADKDHYSTLAGFVEIGESLENAVHREVQEEVGINLIKVTYQASQAWPFPSGLMLGFRAQANSKTIILDKQELMDAQWFNIDQVKQRLNGDLGEHLLFHEDSIEKFLIENWLKEHA
ncbi:MAG: NAD(+) diphosphatase [Alphaproteobacteria bacterium]|nr:NAD(+) diphosphatase [Alphaproteobacteria bacterium]